jgi:hypothetical protein
VQVRPEIETANIVALGRFPAAQLTPLWFAKQSLLRDAEALDASIKLVLDDFVDWTASWLRFQCTAEKLSASNVVGTHWELLPDLVCGVIRSLQDDLSVRAVGFNRVMHFTTSGEVSWHRIGHALAPKEHWEKLLSGHVGTRAVVIQSDDADHEAGPQGRRITVKIEPSVKITHGLYVDVNHHYNLPEGQKTTAPEVIERFWNEAMSRSLSVAHEVLALGAASNGSN